MSNVAQAITWSRDASGRTHLPEVLPQHAVEAVVRDTGNLASIVQRRSSAE